MDSCNNHLILYSVIKKDLKFPDVGRVGISSPAENLSLAKFFDGCFDTFDGFFFAEK